MTASVATPPETDILALAAAFPPISLEEMDGVKLLNRIDTKYVTSEAVLAEVLRDALSAGYRALEADGAKISPYRTIYFDTPQRQMFLDHHNRRVPRRKVRTREYLNSGEAFLEIKRKNNHGRTKKKRIGIPAAEMMDFSADAFATDFLAGHSAYTVAEISPSLATEFSRITLVNPDKTERLTIDTKVNFEDLRAGGKAGLQDAVIIELKQDGRIASRMKSILLDHRV